MRFGKFRFVILMLAYSPAFGQHHALFDKPLKFTHADTLRGSITPQRAWWDLTYYGLHVKVNIADSTISGYNLIQYRVLKPDQVMQIDLMEPLVLDSVIQNGQKLGYRRDGNAFFVSLVSTQRKGTIRNVTAYYHGRPIIAKLPPWDGGLIWARDKLGNPWVEVTCQGMGASVWFPNKDQQYDEPDSASIYITVPDSLVDVSNGRLRSKTDNQDGTTTYNWFVSCPINNYDITMNVGKYVHFSDLYHGLDGPLTLDYWVMPYNLDKAKSEFLQVKSMLKCYEYWFGPYPFYQDGYKLVESHHLGMEHQSCIAYGNHYQNGYLGRDLSHTGWGLKWDFIIIHESAHEWWGNSITSKDLADMWVHESFANYAESLYTECQYGKKAGEDYVIGTRKNIRNDRPIVGVFNVNNEGSEDMYYKGGNMLNTLRHVINNDVLWRQILIGTNHRFWHQTVTGKQIEAYFSARAHMDLSRIFKQYLETTQIPVLEYKLKNDHITYRWSGVIKGFDMRVKAMLKDSVYSFIYPTTVWKTSSIKLTDPDDFRIDRNFYVQVKKENN
ncbi:MAG TPA: M1 family metallopeptidase [Chitinophagaceae bacterium]|nr:M1 family metallopeptidase [Chitinophagaceae bacterium]